MEEICRIFRVPPHMVQYLKRATFSNIEHQSIDFVVHTLDPWLRRIERAIVKDVLLEEEQETLFPQFNVDGLLRGDYKSRMEGYNIGRQGGWMSANDIRRLENLDPIPEEEGGDLYIINGSCVKLKDVGLAYAESAAEEQPPDEEASEPEEEQKEDAPEPEKEDAQEDRRRTPRRKRRGRKRR